MRGIGRPVKGCEGLPGAEGELLELVQREW